MTFTREVFFGSRMESARRMVQDRPGKMPKTELARRSGVPLNRIRQFEAGTRLPGTDEIIAIAKVFEKDVRWFFPPEDSELTPADMT